MLTFIDHFHSTVDGKYFRGECQNYNPRPKYLSLSDNTAIKPET